MKLFKSLSIKLILLFSIQSAQALQPKGDTCMGLQEKYHTLKSGKVSISVDPSVGGRIVSFKLGNYEFLTDKSIHPSNYGSTLWSSPQSMWNWPPPPILDNERYSIQDHEKKIRMISELDNVTGFKFEKELKLLDNDHIQLTYSIINESKETKETAPWEITRLNKGGLLFFPFGEGQIQKKLFEQVPVEIIDGIVWYVDTKEKPKNHQLSIADGSEGWFAFVIERKLYLKKFQDVKLAHQAPGEAEILFYISSEANYIEMEIQGKYETINKGGKTSLIVEWIALDIPQNISISKGS